jgi:hypothetical protein
VDELINPQRRSLTLEAIDLLEALARNFLSPNQCQVGLVVFSPAIFVHLSQRLNINIQICTDRLPINPQPLGDHL